MKRQIASSSTRLSRDNPDEFAEVWESKCERQIVTVDSQRYRLTLLQSGNRWKATTEELGRLGCHVGHEAWMLSALPEVEASSERGAFDQATTQVRRRVRVRVARLKQLGVLSPFVRYDDIGRISWSDPTGVLSACEMNRVPASAIEMIGLFWAHLNLGLERGALVFQRAGESGPKFLSNEARPPYRNDAPPKEPVREFEWPAERPDFWPKDWAYPPPDDWEPPGGWGPPPPPYDGPTIGPAPSPQTGLREGVTKESHWWGSCYCMESEVVDELIDAFNETAAVSAGGSTGAGVGAGTAASAALKKWLPIVTLITGLYSAACWWWSAHLNRVRRDAKCKEFQTAGVKICLYAWGVYPSASPCCYPPDCCGN